MSTPANRPRSASGQCRHCIRRRDVFSCPRSNGGNYRSAPRRRSSSVCGDCATGLLATANAYQTSGGWDLSSIHRIVETIDTDQARAAVARFEDLKAEKETKSKADEARMRPYIERVREREEILTWIRGKAATTATDIKALTCRVVAHEVDRSGAASTNAGLTYAPDGTMTFTKTMREQVVEFLTTIDPSDLSFANLDQPTIDALAAEINAGAHVPPATYEPPTPAAHHTQSRTNTGRSHG